MKRSARLQAQASRWIVRLDAGAMGAAERDALAQWRAKSAAHEAAFLEAAQVWGLLDRAAETPRASVAPFPRRTFGRVRAVSIGLAAAAAIVIAATVTLPVGGSKPEAIYSTSVGETLAVSLPDGSSMTLNTESRATYEFDQAERLVDLLDGEAYFDVSKDPRRPFRVRTPGGIVTAVGTAFSVRVSKGELRVAVADGVVAVKPADEPGLPKREIRLSAGERLAASAGAVQVAAADPPAVVAQLSWRQGLLVFDGEPLPDALAELGRYAPERVVIADPELESLLLTGTFRAGATIEVLDALRQGFGVAVERREGGVYVLTQPGQADGLGNR